MKSSIEKGNWIEDFFKENLTKEFEILRHPSPIFSEKSYIPDFLVKHNSTGIIFNLECKYRTYVNNQNHLYDLNEEQFLRFEIECEHPILYLIGLGVSNEKLMLKDLFLAPIIELNPIVSSKDLQVYKFAMNDFEKEFIYQCYKLI